MIERARQRREFEASLPPIKDEESLELRRKMVEEQEMREWEYREEQIRKQQTYRLKMIEQAVRTQEEERELLNSKKIESIVGKAAANRDATISRIKDQRIAGNHLGVTINFVKFL